MRKFSAKIRVTALSVLAAVAISVPDLHAATLKVNCDKGNQTIQKALDKAENGDTINVSGSCSENITISKDGIQLIDLDGATITAQDPAENVVTILARRVVVRGFTISGGREGIKVAEGGSAVIGGPEPAHSNTVENNARNGIAVVDGGFARIEGNVVQNNGTLTANRGSHGVVVSRNASADILNNTITGNIRRGITVAGASAAAIGGNTITNNGFNKINAGDAGFTRPDSGIGVVEVSHVDLVGTNTIQNNRRFGFDCGLFSTAEVLDVQVFGGNFSGSVRIRAGQCFVSNKSGAPFP